MDVGECLCGWTFIFTCTENNVAGQGCC